MQFPPEHVSLSGRDDDKLTPAWWTRLEQELVGNVSLGCCRPSSRMPGRCRAAASSSSRYSS
jgi:hypothetical protein